MNVLYLTIIPRKTQRMTLDIAEELVSRGHNVFVVCPCDTEDIPIGHFTQIGKVNYLFVKSGYSTGKVGLVRKVINFLTIDSRFNKAMQGVLKTTHIDMILYSTPPITLVNTIKWVKRKYNVVSYLMLKDIFPQNAVDLGMMKTKGIMGLPYLLFREKERNLYAVSDYIGCMSDANVNYVLRENPEINPEKVGLCVNSLHLQNAKDVDVVKIRALYGIPQDRVVFLYGGNLGKPQGLQFLVDILRTNKDKKDRYFVICGSGNDQQRITSYINDEKPENVLFISRLSPDDFDVLTRATDVGMIFLDKRFTIPNFPSRLLSIMLNEKPAIAATDKNTDIGDVITNNKFGWWCESGDLEKYNFYLDSICSGHEDIELKGKKAREYYEANYTTATAVNQILKGYNIAKLQKQ